MRIPPIPLELQVLENRRKICSEAEYSAVDVFHTVANDFGDKILFSSYEKLFAPILLIFW